MQEVDKRSYRVLMIAPTSFFADYGCHVRILEEIQVLQKLGHQVTLVTYRNGQNLPGLKVHRTLPIPWRQGYEVGSSRHKIAFDALLGLSTLALLMRRRFDVIHAHLHEGALIGLVLGRLWGLPVLFDFQGSLTEEMVDHGFLARDSRPYGFVRRLECWINRSSARILTSSLHARRLLVEKFGCAEDQVQTLPDCVNSSMFRPSHSYTSGELNTLRQQLGIPAERNLIVYLGLLAEHQGTSHLLLALQKICQARQDVHLLLMGFPNQNLYQQQAKELGIADYVTFTGRIPYHNAPLYIALGDVAVAPKRSKTEGAGKLLNYMSIGLPTVAYDIPVAREYLGLEGIFARQDDISDLAEKLLKAISLVSQEPATAQFIGERLRKRAMNLFDWETAGRQIVEAYGELVLGEEKPKVTTQRWVANRE